MTGMMGTAFPPQSKEVAALRIAVDALLYSRQSAGIGHYIAELFTAYAQTFPEDELHLVVNPGVAIPGTRAIVPGREMRTSFQRLMFEQTALPRLIAKAGCDVVHFPDYQLPLVGRLPRAVITVHDLVAFRLPETFPPRVGWVKRQLMARSVRRAAHIIVPSRATRDDLVDILGVDPGRITVIGHGVSRMERHQGPPPYPRPYFLSVGTLEPRKNLVRLIQGYARLAARRRGDCPDLVVAGRPGWMYAEIYRAPHAAGVAERVRFLDYVPDADLPAWYSHAVALCYPSLYEGFGLPMAEAMMVATPVVASARGGLAEIGAGVAIEVDPLDIDSIADGMERVLSCPGEVEMRRRRGRERVREMTWEAAAVATRMVYQEVDNRV